MSCSRLAGSKLLCRGCRQTDRQTDGWRLGHDLFCSGSKNSTPSVYLASSSGLTDLKDLRKVCVPVGEHGVDAVDGVLGLTRGSPLGFGLQYRQQDTEGSQWDKDSYKVQNTPCVNDRSALNPHDWMCWCVMAAALIRRRRTNVRLDVREALLHLAARVPEDLQCGLGHLLVVHLQAAEQRLERLGRVEGHGVREGENLRGRESGESCR